MCAAIPHAIVNFPGFKKFDEKNRQTKVIWDHLTVLQHAEVVDILHKHSAKQFMHCIQLRHAEKPAGVNAHDEDDETEQLLDDTFKINGETFHMPEDAMTFGLRGPVVELYVKQESAEFVHNHLDDACRYVAAHAVWHTCKFYQKQCAHEKHQAKRAEGHHDLSQRAMEEQRELFQKERTADMETGVIRYDNDAKVFYNAAGKIPEQVPEQKRKERRPTLSMAGVDGSMGTSVLEAAVVDANSVRESGQVVHHPSDSRERLLAQLELCHENKIDGANWENPGKRNCFDSSIFDKKFDGNYRNFGPVI